jgi:ubiquinone/menaquinone biosynthesis C-methylase UbiE
LAVTALKCVQCGQTGLDRDAGGWQCAACGATFPIIDGVGRFVASEHYTGSFGYQWNTFAQAQLDSANGTRRSRDTFVEKTGLSLESLRGKRVLDAGCGMGRFAEVCIEAGADVHAIDLSTAVEAAARNLGHHPNVSFYQADIMNLPFPDGTFDIVYSIGVLHHTPDTKRAFLGLSRLVKAGGLIVIWVYSTIPNYVFGGELLRLLTPRLPKPLLLKMSKVAIPLYHVHRLPVVGRVSTALLPTSVNPDPEWRWLDTFDWYSPRYQWKHTYDEVEGWFREAGLIDIAREPFPVAVRGARAAGA